MKFLGVRAISVLAALGFCFALDAICRNSLDSSAQRLVILAGLYVTLAVSLNLINGITGQFSIGHAAFYQVGAVTTTYLSFFFFKSQGMQAMMWLGLMMIAGAVAAGLAGLVVGLPSLRLRGDYLAIVTLGFGEIARIVVQTIEFKAADGAKVGGSYGMNVEPRVRMIWLVWLLAIISIAICRNLLKNANGLAFLSVREDEVAASAMGVNTARTKVTAFVIGSALAGAAGVLLAHAEGFISPATFPMDMSFIILTMVVLGGTGSITGSVLAAILLFYVPEYLRNLQNPDKTPLVLSGSTLVASFLAVVLLVVLLKRIAVHFHGTNGRKLALFAGAAVVSFVGFYLFRLGLGYVPAVNNAQYEAQKLRMVIFAATLIILMLLRPQGVLAHHEFSWNWLARLYRFQKKPEVVQS